ncbi:MAG: hypothetical protein ACOCUD_04200 [Bacillota bacterium]
MAKKNPKKTIEEEQISSGTIKVNVWVRFGSDTRQKRAEYEAIEKKDEYNNLISFNEVYKHNEDVDFTQEEAYTDLKITLGLAGKSKEDQIEAIEKEINRYTKRVKALEKHPELNILANIWDEKRKLAELDILKKYSQYRSEQGAYYTLDKGIRNYNFESIGGFLVPIWQGCDNMVDYPDYTRKKKIVLQENQEFKNYLDAKKKENIQYASLITVLLITSVVLIALLVALVITVRYHQGAVDDWEKPAEYCADQMAKTYGVVNTLLQDEVINGCLAERNSSILPQVKENLETLNPD